VAVEERTALVEGTRVFYRAREGGGVPTVFLHGNPTHSEDWMPFLDRMSGAAIAPDLPGWGRSDHPRHLDYTMEGLATHFERLLDALGIDEHNLVVHDWGALALIAAQRAPERVRRLVLINAVPLLPGYRWHWVARFLWRVPVIGELANLTTTRVSLRLVSRQASPRAGPLPDEFLDMLWRGWSRGVHRPMLTLYRSADPDQLADAGRSLGGLRGESLVIWGGGDPYLPARFGRQYADRLPNGELVELPDAGHWPWLERPEVIDRVASFVDRS
jgi:pimeloyl-ACP methyl ester carboxylesterase